eukprot:GHVN01018075.1.p1 GENE.GHVN01018075.1~~GHVN01018075.1.p1  ORF type:complete len:292 (-),score=33.95 GHVN01018075.1:472-1347(-)
MQSIAFQGAVSLLFGLVVFALISYSVFLSKTYSAPRVEKKLRLRHVEEKAKGMSGGEIETRYWELKNIEFNCTNKQRMGKKTDGGWDICASEPFTPKQNDCLVYSFGINGDFSFDDAMGDTYGCQVHSFDPSMKVKSHQRSDHVSFENIGLWGSNTVNKKGWKLETLGTILERHNDTDRLIDVLKFDIEHGEWPSFPTMFKEDSIRNVMNLAFETHVGKDPKDRTAKYMEAMEVHRELHRRGFRRFHYSDNMACKFTSPLSGKIYTSCSEFGYVNLGLTTTNMTTKSPHPS